MASTASRLDQIEDNGWDPAKGGWRGSVTPAARPLLATFKRQLRELIGRELTGDAGSGTAEAIQARLIEALAREGIPLVEDRQTDYPYGKVLGLEVRRPAGLDGWLAVVVTQRIHCDLDKSLYAFERREGSWRLAFALEANPDQGFEGGMARLDFGISQPDRQGGSFIVVADRKPRCVQDPRPIRYRAFRLGGDPMHLQPLLIEEGGLYLSDFELSVEGDRFVVRFLGSQSLDFGITSRSIVHAYRITGTKAERIGPLADEERGFIDEWISLPWEVAERWAGPPRRSSLRTWHQRLRALLPASGRTLDTEFEPSGTCGPSRSLEVLHFDGGGPPELVPREVFFTVQRHGDDFEMERIDVTAPEGCTRDPDPQVP